MSISSEKLRKVLHPIQIDTMHFRFKPRRNPGSQSQHRSVNRTAVIGANFLGNNISATRDITISEETKREIKERANKVVNEVQVRDLSNVKKLLAQDIFCDPQERYYIVIDRLDENWVEESIRYRLIKALSVRPGTL